MATAFLSPILNDCQFNDDGLFLVGGLMLGVWILYASIVAARSKTDAANRRLLLVTVIYLPLLFILMVADKL